MQPYTVMAQASPEEILGAVKPDALNLETLSKHSSIREVQVVLPDLQGAKEAQQHLASWGYKAFIGDAYNVCQRLLRAHENVFDQSFIVRVLAIWKHIDLPYVDCLVERIRLGDLDFVATPLDFDFTLSADVASIASLARIAELQGDSQEISRAHFNPWGYMETHPGDFKIERLEPAPVYDTTKISAIIAAKRCHPENEFFGRDYTGSRYHYILDHIPQGSWVLDIACGSGFGSALLAQRAHFVLGVDYLESYITAARERFPESARLQFSIGDGSRFLYQGRQGCFDVVVSLHTLEHVPDDSAMLSMLYRNLRPSGTLIVEVPLLARRPLGIPINPYHLREYDPAHFVDLVQSAGFSIQKIVGSCRSFYGSTVQARDAIQVHALRPTHDCL